MHQVSAKILLASWMWAQWLSSSIWKPLRGPLSDWPLAVCDEETVDGNEDYIASDVVSRSGFTENYLIYFNPRHRWYYLSRQKATELVLFRQADTQFPELKGKKWKICCGLRPHVDSFRCSSQRVSEFSKRSERNSPREHWDEGVPLLLRSFSIFFTVI